MSKRLLHIVSLLLCVACVFNMSAQEAMDSVTIDSILSARYPRISPIYLDSTQIAEQASSINVPVVSSAEYSETPTSVSLDFNKSVGQIPIKSGTSPSGAKTYEIPLDVYPGMNGMTPSLSLSYNSHGGNGVIGVGWSLSGVSAIIIEITEVALTGSAIPQLTQEIEYTSFHRPSDISEGYYHSHFIYNSDFDRVKMHVTRNGVNYLRRYYLGGCYERDVDSLSNVTERLYLGGDYYTAPAVLIKTDSIESLHFIHRDYLGSITHITDDDGVVEQELSYDAWGRLRDPATHEVYAPGEEPELMIGRGYTGHEHITWHGLINMNARLYDPVLGRFLSPDPFVQAPDLSQNFNRYTYAMNNPFRFTDQSGEFWWFVLGAVAGGTINLIQKAVSGDIQNIGDCLTAFGIGALAGTIGGAAGSWAFGVATAGVTGVAGAGGFLAGATSGAVSTAISAPIQNIGNMIAFGDPFMSPKEYVYSVLGGALTGGTINGIVAKINGRNFWTGAEKNSAQKIIEAYNEGTFSNNNTSNTADSYINDSYNTNSSSTKNTTNNNYTRFIANEDGSIIDMKPTIDRISKGETILRFKHDGTIFRNEELLLPKINSNYTEWVVPTPGLPSHRAGVMRIVFGNGKYWFTKDHYKTFILLNSKY